MSPSSGIWVPSDPYLHRWMMFVDGENLVIRAKKLADDRDIESSEGPYYNRDVFVWLPEIDARSRWLSS
jgi:hypothetical protein